MRARKILGLVLACVVLLAAACVGAVLAGGAPLAAKLIESAGSARLGREIRLGHLDIRWGSPLRLAADDVRIANVAWGSAPDLFASKHVELDLHFVRKRVAVGDV